MNKEWIIHGFLVFLVLSLIIAIPGAATSTEVRIVKFASDGYTILNETTVDYRWMEQHLPVQGDGSTHYYLQGPVFADNPDDRWNPAEDTNVKEKDMGAVKGTNTRDLCDLVGGMAPEDELVVKATDGFSRTFAYDNIYSPSSRQGPVILAWYRGDIGYVPTYTEGMRLLFLADTSGNPWGIHAMGVWDWHESAAEQYWYYYYNGNERYPTTTGLSVQSVGELQVFSQEEPTGVINVTSRPDGGRIYLDDEDTGQLTPASVTGIPVGTHSVRVEKDGYEVPDEAWVDVAYNRVSEASFDLMQIPAMPADGSGESSAQGSDANGKESGPSGSELGFFAQNTLQGTLSLAEIQGMNGSWKDGMERPFMIPGLPDQGLAFGRLYLFTTNCSDTALNEDPLFILKISGRSIRPDRVYSDQGVEGSVITFAYNLSGLTGKDSAAVLRMESPLGSSCTVEGVIVLLAVRNETAPLVSFRVHEGADLIASPPGQALTDTGTTTEFDMDPSGEPYTQANLTFISTGMTDDPAPRYQVQVNGETISGTFPASPDPIYIARISFEPPLPGSPVVTSFVALINQTNAVYGETRVAVFTFSGGNTSNPAQSGPSENKSTESEQNEHPIATAPPVTPEESGQSPAPPAPADIHEPPATGPIHWITDIFDAITGFILTLFGGPVPATETGTAAPNPEAGNQGMAENSPGASPPGTGDELQGHAEVVNNESAIPLDADIGPPDVDEKTQDNTPGARTGTPVSHHGGVYITSYPADAELRIDNKVIARHLPAVVYGMKEGIHAIEVRVKSDDNRVLASRSSRVWIYPDAITTAHFDLVSPGGKQQVHVVSREESPVSFTLNGYYPLQRTPADIELTGADPFISVIRNDSYLSYTLPARVFDTGEMVIPSETPPMYQLPVESTPSGAEVIVDGIRTGFRTPAVVPNLSAGMHRIMVTAPGYEPGEEVTYIPVNSEPVAAPVRFTLQTYPCGSLTLETMPPGGTIYIDGILTGEKTPYLFTGIPLGIHEVTLRRNGENRMIDVVVKPDEIQRYVVAFRENGTKDVV
jgi:hypothetical protein